MLAVIISLLKVFLPYADNYKRDIESYILAEFNAEVSIGSIGASWQSFGPAVVLNDVSLTASEEAPLDISIQKTEMNIDFWRSIQEQRLVTGAFLLEGIETKINSDVFFKVRPQSQGSQLFEGLSHLFLSQVQQFSVIDSKVLVKHRDGQLQTYQIDDLAWVNDGNHHRGQGEVYIDGFSNNSLAIQMELYGQRRSEIFGQIYVEAQQVDITPWLTQFIGEHVAVTSTEANFRVWGNIKDGLVDDLLVDIKNTGVRWQKQTTEKFLFVDDAQLAWQQLGSDWQLLASDIKLKTESTQPEPFDLVLTKSKSDIQLYTNDVEVNAMANLLSLFSVTKDSTFLANADISGDVKQLSIQWPNQGSMRAFVDVEGFGYLPEPIADEAYLGVKQTRLQLAWADNKGWVQLVGKKGQLLTEDTFIAPFYYDELAVNLAVDVREQGVWVSLEQFVLNNADLNIDAEAQYSSVDDGHLSLYAEVIGPTQGKILNYLPRHLIGPDTHAYLTKAIQAGAGKLTRVVIDGPVATIPYESSPGTFLVEAELVDGKFEFDEDWPAIENMDATLTVNKLIMGIAARKGQLGPVTINDDVYGELDLGAPNTLLTLDITPNQLAFDDFHQLIDTSPLEDILGEVFDFVRLSGQGAANVHLILPLDDNLDANGVLPETVARGTVKTVSAGLEMPRLELNFEDIDAFISFENEAFTIHSGKGTWNKLPVKMMVAGNQVTDDYNIYGQLTGIWKSTDLKKQLPETLTPYITGKLNNNVLVDVTLSDVGYQYDVVAETDLTQAEYKITGPLIKGKGIPSQLSVTVSGNEQINDIYANLDDRVFFAGEAPNSSGVISRALLQVGQAEDLNQSTLFTSLPNEGFDIEIDLPGAEFTETLSFVLDLIDTIPDDEVQTQTPQTETSTENLIVSDTGALSRSDINGFDAEGQDSDIDIDPPFLSAPDRVAGKFGYIDIFGQRWSQANLTASPKANGWQFLLNSDKANVDVFVHEDIEINGIDITAKRLDVVIEKAIESSAENTSSEQIASENGASEVESLTDSAGLIRNLPDLHVLCENCTYNKKPLGKIKFDTFSRDDTLFIESASMIYQRNEVKLTGIWAGDKGAGKTNLNGEIYSRYFGQWMLDWELNTGIKQSDLHSKFSLSWDGAPHEFTFSSLNGDTTFELGEGYLSEVSDKGARIFSLFSLNSLYRKLKFDFNDVFQKGLFYNDIKGSMQIENGRVYSEDIFMDGVAGNMNMRGFTDLNQNTLDYDVTFKPKITSSIPVIAAWLAPGTAGLSFLAGIAIDKIIEKADVVSEVRMKITGQLSEPNVQEVKRFTKTIDIPGAKEAKEKAEKQRQKQQQEKQQQENQLKLNEEREQALKRQLEQQQNSAPIQPSSTQGSEPKTPIE
ncbi:TIGR02099 family protein [Psychrosphaera ytuae]|uniref:TIGR02099 family protein n=1 Tax=Psychrosphaera ytuae TaxID=2820710 RepID=A0A975DD19_9GAMM|nr:YhdP family protein [Psychrosphaera ytuae]QTH63415.1 TIGR02099 family protein [Psychrosphaera ytuae]